MQLFVLNLFTTVSNEGNIYSWFSSISEASASEILENHEEMFPEQWKQAKSKHDSVDNITKYLYSAFLWNNSKCYIQVYANG